MPDYPSVRYGLTVITRPTFEPITTDQAKAHLRVEIDEDDALIDSLVTAAREWVERYTGLTLCETVLEAAFEGYPDWYIELPKPPVIEIESFKYRDADGTDTTLATDQYALDNAFGIAPRVVPAYGITWPGTRWQASSLRVRYRAGYARAGSPDETGFIPQPLVAAIKLLLGHLYEHREAVTEARDVAEIPLGVQWLCRPYRVEGLGA